MFARLALEEDFNDIFEMAALYTAEVLPEHKVEFNACRRTMDDYLETASPTIFVCEGKNRALVGFTLAYVHKFAFKSALFTVQEIIYVKPENRGSRAAALLTQTFVEWSDNLGAEECIAGNSNGFRSERTARFFQRFGFEHVGYSLKRRANA